VTWSNTITDHSREIQEAEKGKLPEKVGRKATDLCWVLGLGDWVLDIWTLRTQRTPRTQGAQKVAGLPD